MKTNTLLRIAKSVIVLSSLLFFKTGKAQTTYNDQRAHYGLTVSFGDRVNTVSSNYSAIDEMNLVVEGGSLGLLWGNRSIETKLMLGYYYSASCVPHTTDLIELETSANFYPLSLVSKKFHTVEPYLTGGISKQFYKMYGYYVEKENLPANHSSDLEPHLGNVDVYMLSIGTGISVNLYDRNDFVKLFADVKYNSPIMAMKSAAFGDTHMSSQLAVNVGLSFGFNR